eukprot:CAMPEP_0174852988 /NCGR_PEP_ID=MMETSP1114-20130205/27303_1 /TAXON_ID=312471 /ORGANISM="Neobodo designis, Strain CCAP 1951/1" /LENGTH=43 /DNA_ID= /DNA_START= /DNA_END= /DNA_ORIENTATION=
MARRMGAYGDVGTRLSTAALFKPGADVVLSCPTRGQQRGGQRG